MTTPYITGFKDPIHDSQKTFRQALLAMSEPGKWQQTSAVEAIESLNPGTISLVLSLLDADTYLWLPKAWQSIAVSANLTFHSGCKITSIQEKAQFAIYDLADFLAETSFDFSLGDERYPDQSTTIIIQLPENMPNYQSKWQGPGIQNHRLCELPLPAEFWNIRQKLIAFPCGIDFIFTRGDQILALPRTTQISL